MQRIAFTYWSSYFRPPIRHLRNPPCTHLLSYRPTNMFVCNVDTHCTSSTAFLLNVLFPCHFVGGDVLANTAAYDCRQYFDRASTL